MDLTKLCGRYKIPVYSITKKRSISGISVSPHSTRRIMSAIEYFNNWDIHLDNNNYKIQFGKPYVNDILYKHVIINDGANIVVDDDYHVEDINKKFLQNMDIPTRFMQFVNKLKRNDIIVDKIDYKFKLYIKRNNIETFTGIIRLYLEDRDNFHYTLYDIIKLIKSDNVEQNSVLVYLYEPKSDNIYGSAIIYYSEKYNAVGCSVIYSFDSKIETYLERVIRNCINKFNPIKTTRKNVVFYIDTLPDIDLTKYDNIFSEIVEEMGLDEFYDDEDTLCELYIKNGGDKDHYEFFKYFDIDTLDKIANDIVTDGDLPTLEYCFETMVEEMLRERMLEEYDIDIDTYMDDEESENYDDVHNELMESITMLELIDYIEHSSNLRKEFGVFELPNIPYNIECETNLQGKFVFTSIPDFSTEFKMSTSYDLYKKYKN